MIMNKRILYLLSVLCFFSFSACTSEEEPVLTEELGEIWLSVVDTSKVEVVTRALSGFDVKDFNVSLSRGETMVFSSRKYGDRRLADHLQCGIRLSPYGRELHGE